MEFTWEALPDAFAQAPAGRVAAHANTGGHAQLLAMIAFSFQVYSKLLGTVQDDLGGLCNKSQALQKIILACLIKLLQQYAGHV